MSYSDIFVPPERVLDTVDIYFIQERQRRLSLRFLSYCVLKEEIQIDTHDSIEDARAALLLHQKWEERTDDFSFNELKQWVYAEGKKLVSLPVYEYDPYSTRSIELQTTRSAEAPDSDADA